MHKTDQLSSLGIVNGPQFPERIRARDPEALQTVVHSYLRQIHRAAGLACQDAHLAEEVTQATFTTFIEKADRFEGRSHVRTWLFGILYKKLAESRRELHRKTRTESIEEVIEQRFDKQGKWTRPPRPVDMQFYDTEVRQALEACLEALPTRQRMVFILREVEGLGTDEICEIMGLTRTNLGSILCRVRNRLRECLEVRGVRS